MKHLLPILTLGAICAAPLAQAQLTVNYKQPEDYADIAYPDNRKDEKALKAVSRELNEELGDLYTKYFGKENQAPLELTFDEIDLAGEIEWWRVNLSDTRIMKDIYPPRFTITYKVKDQNGNVVKEDTKRLIDMSYLMTTRPFSQMEQLPYEKRLLESFFRNELSGMKEVAQK